MKTIYSYIIFSLLLGLCACSEDEMMYYGDTNFVYFEREGEDGALPIQRYTFLLEDDATNEKEVEIPIILIGSFTEADQLVGVEIVDSLTTAEAGKHYQLNDAKQVFYPNSMNGNLIVNALRVPEMKDSVFTIGLKIISNEAFNAAQNNVLILEISDLFVKPDWWPLEYTNTGNLGEFTVAKATLWLKFMGISDGSDPWAVPPYVAYYNHYADGWGWHPSKADRVSSLNSFILWLRESEGAPYYDENGELVLSTF